MRIITSCLNSFNKYYRKNLQNIYWNPSRKDRCYVFIELVKPIEIQSASHYSLYLQLSIQGNKKVSASLQIILKKL